MKSNRSGTWLSPLHRMPIDEWCVALALFALVYAFEANVGRIFSDDPPVYRHLGAEYYNIAVALVDGRGYSDPFAEITGPTAWMPPLYPALLAALLLLLKTQIAVAEAIVLLTVASLSAVGLMLFRMAKRSAQLLSPYIIVGLYVVWLWAFYFWFFFLTHDIWLITLLAACMCWSVHRYSSNGTWNGWWWGALGGIAALTSPSLAVAWGVLSGVLFLSSRAQRRGLVLAGLLASGMAAPWLVRNALVFHQFIPTKANLFYEAYQANYRYDGGIYDNSWNEHPNVSSRFRFHYAKLGEQAFIREHEQKFWSGLKADPGRYAQNVLNRLLAVTVVHPDQGAYDSPPKMVVRRIVYVLPIVGLFLGLALRAKHRALLQRLMALWAAYLVPYVLVAFYLRYLLPMTSCLMLMTFIGADELAARVVTLERSRRLARPRA